MIDIQDGRWLVEQYGQRLLADKCETDMFNHERSRVGTVKAFINAGGRFICRIPDEAFEPGAEGELAWKPKPRKQCSMSSICPHPHTCLFNREDS